MTHFSSIKCCGLRQRHDMRQVIQQKSAYAGLVFAPGSPREVTLRQARALTTMCQASQTNAVALTVNASATDIQLIASQTGIRTFQLHGQESPCLAQSLPHLDFIKAFAYRHNYLDNLQTWLQKNPKNWIGLLVDAPPLSNKPGEAGGTGHCLPWRPLHRLLTRLKHSYPHLPQIFIAGGLNADNLRQAQREINADVWDTSSGLEQQRGVKSARRIREFCRSSRR